MTEPLSDYLGIAVHKRARLHTPASRSVSVDHLSRWVKWRKVLNDQLVVSTGAAVMPVRSLTRHPLHEDTIENIVTNFSKRCHHLSSKQFVTLGIPRARFETV